MEARLLYIKCLLPCYGRQGDLNHWDVHNMSISGLSLPFYSPCRCKDRKDRSNAAKILFLNKKKKKLNSNLTCRGSCQISASLCTHLYHSLPSALPSSHCLPHVHQDLAHHRSLNPSFDIKGRAEVKNKMVAWYSDSFPWLQTAGTDWKG